ncbi:MAG: histidine phosphatase family protein [Candidatus Colwellbacteria bacterium]|nr:histidine phosphatase family protein [Candidatus Colwellbacteria bacterium]
MDKFEGVPEQVVAPEIPREDWETLIVLQRHGRYDNRRPADPDNLTEEERAYGHLTAEGIEEARKRADERIAAILEEHPETKDFLILNSPTFWLDDERLGQRARETAEIIAGEISKKLKELGLPEGQLLNNSGRFKGNVSRPDVKLGEGLMFQVPEFAKFLRGQFGGKQPPAFWQAFNRDTYREKREELGAEGPDQIATRVNEGVNVAARFAEFYHRQHPGRKLAVWMVTHGDGLDPFVQRVVGAPEEDFSAGYNEGIGIAVDSSGVTETTIKGKEYKLPVARHGKPAPIRRGKFER